MQWQTVDTGNCSVARTLAVVGEKWSLLVLRETYNGLRRFDEVRRHLGVSDAVLSDRLRTLVGAGILERRTYREPGQRSRTEYAVTDAGWELQPVVVGLLQWGDRHLGDAGGPMVQVRHRGCGAPVEAVVRCTEHGEALRPRETELAPGPGLRLLPPEHPSDDRPSGARPSGAA
jgi:DNA-binding HxlR family transcriptional regulator